MKVKNLNGTSQTDCKCGSWLKHWEKFSGKKAGYCSVSNCNKIADVGGHVQKSNSASNDWYIIPLCTEHNNKHGQELEISDSTILISANKSLTCDK